MAHLTKDKKGINARIVFWGIGGAGVSTNLQVIHAKLRADNRGRLSQIPTRLDPTVHYELLPIELGQVNGLRTQLEVIGVPGGPEHGHTRKQLLDHIDGLVFVVDSQPERQDENLASLGELQAALAAYGRALHELPVVVQYNKRDLSDPYTIEALHRKLGLGEAAIFEAVASEGTGVLQTLTTISKRVIRVLRETAPEPAPGPLPASVPSEPVAPPRVARRLAEPASRAVADDAPSGVELMEDAILAEGNALDAEADAATILAREAFDRPWDAVSGELKPPDGMRIGADFELVSVGTATRAGARGLRIPLVLGNPEGESVTLALTIQLDPLLDHGEE